MINIYLYEWSKKMNSTAVPPLPEDIPNRCIELDIEFKDVTNMFTPEIIVSTGIFLNENPMPYTYCWIPAFERYYFVRSWSWVLGRWEASLEIDTLASFRTDIGRQMAYVLRASAARNPDVMDTKYFSIGTAASSSYQAKSFPNVYSPWNTNIYSAKIYEGFFLLSVVNNDINAVGAVSHYAVEPRVMAEIFSKLYSSPSWMNITDGNISQDLQKMLINPIQYITRLMWIPTGLDTSGLTGVSTLPYGWWSVSLTSGVVYRLSQARVKITVPLSFPIQRHPQFKQAETRYLQMSPYTEISMYYPPFGFLKLDGSKLYGCSSIETEVRLDVITGAGTLIVSGSGGGTIYATTAQVGVPISIAQMAVDMSRIQQQSTWIGSAGIAMATGGLQHTAEKAVNGFTQGVMNFLNHPVQSIKEGWNKLMSMETTDLLPAAKEAAAPLLNSMASTAADIGSAALASSGVCESKGSTGGFAALTEQCFIQWYFLKMCETDPEHYGYPLCERRVISTLPGFILCANEGSLQLNATPAERQIIIAYMCSGFYYE